MYVSFDQLPPHARVWVYPSPRTLSTSDKELITDVLTKFCDQWNAHGNPLRSSFTILNEHFVVLAVDEQWSGASGCSIDSSVRSIKEISDKISVDLLNRGIAVFQLNGKIESISLPTLKEKHKQGIWNAQSPSFNIMVQTKEELENKWLIPAGETWLKRYLMPVEAPKAG